MRTSILKGRRELATDRAAATADAKAAAAGATAFGEGRRQTFEVEDPRQTVEFEDNAPEEAGIVHDKASGLGEPVWLFEVS